MHHRVSILLAATAVSALAFPSAASAQLPSVGGVVGGVTDTVGGVVDTTTAPLDDTLDRLLGGGEGALPDDAVGDVLTSIGLTPTSGAPGGQGGSGGSGGGTTTVLPGGTAGDGTRTGGGSSSGSGSGSGYGAFGGSASYGPDSGAPRATVNVVSRLSQIERTGTLKLEVRSDEAGVVAFTALVRPGHKRRGVAPGLKHDRSVIHLEPVVVAFRSAGTVPVSIRLGRDAHRRLARSKNGRISVAVLAADLDRNQTGERLKRMLQR